MGETSQHDFMDHTRLHIKHMKQHRLQIYLYLYRDIDLDIDIDTDVDTDIDIRVCSKQHILKLFVQQSKRVHTLITQNLVKPRISSVSLIRQHPLQ